MTWFDKNIYWETSAINYMVDNFERNDAIATKAFQTLKRNRFYISPVTIWEILLTADEIRRERIIFYIQHLFHDHLLNSPSEFIANFIKQGCPAYEKKYDFHSKLPIAKTWNNICKDNRLTFIYDQDLLKKKSKFIQDLSKQLNKIINRVVLDIHTNDVESQYQDFLNFYYKKLSKKLLDSDDQSIKVQKISILFILFILCLEFELDNAPIKEFWKRYSIDGITERIEFLLNKFEILFYRGPFVEMALMAYNQVSSGTKSNRGLFFDCMHCIYMTYTDLFITRDDHFVRLRDHSNHILFSRIFHMDELQLVTHKRNVIRK